MEKINVTTGTDIKDLLGKCKEEVMKLSLPNNEKGAELKKQLIKFGISEADVSTKAWTSIKKVIGSKYNERAYTATKKIGVTLNDIRMAVLIQNVIPSEYSFVIHTKNPLNGNKNEIYVEIVKGLGETLVGKIGRAHV